MVPQTMSLLEMEKGRKGGGTGGMSASPVSRAIDPKKEDWIGRQLRRVYDDAANEPLPDELMLLLQKIQDETSDPSSSPH